jgi:cell wall-associated NlpC family hydrolase
MSGGELARAAERYVGAAFRPHGRDPITGFDCLGLVLMAMADIGRPIRFPLRYALRNRDLGRFERLPAKFGLAEVEAPFEAGDMLLLETGPAQLHLAIIAGEGGIVHAHAGLRRVVHTPFPVPWPIVRQWRLTSCPAGAVPANRG